MKITYTGSTPSLEIDHDAPVEGGGTEKRTYRVKTGETIDVPEALGEDLCRRTDFKRASRSPQHSKTPTHQSSTLP